MTGGNTNHYTTADLLFREEGVHSDSVFAVRFWNVISSESRSLAARLAQSAERKALNLVVVGSSPTVGVSFLFGIRKVVHVCPYHDRVWLACAGCRPRHRVADRLALRKTVASVV